MTREDAANLCIDATTELAGRHNPTADATVQIIARYLDLGQPVAWEEVVMGLVKTVVIA